jgi:UDPglucose 6-dehydrogenase
VRRGIGTDARIGSAFLFAGAGYGGSCFPKDVQALIRTLNHYNVDAGMLESTERINETQKHLLLEMTEQRFGPDLQERTFAVWGLSFKPETDDMREAASLTVVNGLLERGAQVRVNDPEAMGSARHHFGDRVIYCDNNYDALEGADALLILTEWQPYRRPDMDRVRALLRAPVVFDGRNLFEPTRMRDTGFEYYCIGRPGVSAVPAGGR